MHIRTWDGSRPRKCQDYSCAASDRFWFKEMAPKRFVGTVGGYTPPHEWSSCLVLPHKDGPFTSRSWWYFCDECHEIMDMEKLLFSKIRENVSIDATAEVSENQ